MIELEPPTVARDRKEQVKWIRSALSVPVYRSTSVRTPLSLQLDELTLSAQAINGCVSIKGLMVYDDDDLTQRVKGLVDNVDRIMPSITRDARHANNEILYSNPVGHKSFADWETELATPCYDLTACRIEISNPLHEVEGLRCDPNTARNLLLAMVPIRAADAITETLPQYVDSATP